MDPLAIATGAAALVGTCIKISATLYQFIDDARNVDSNITSLCDEILGLSRILDAISKSWKQSPLIVIARADPDGNLWTSVKASIDECKKTLERLDGVVNDVQRESIFGRGFFRKPTRSIRLNRKTNDILAFRQQIQSYSIGMQSALQMINVCLLIHGQSSQASVMQSLESLKTQIGRVEGAIRTHTASLPSPETPEEDQITQTLQRLVHAAEIFHSSASSVAGGSTVWGGSVMGEALNEEQYNRIEGWISEPIEEESIRDHQSESTRVTPHLASSSTSGPSLSTNPAATADLDSGSDSDLEHDMIRRFEELAMAKIDQRDYAKAEVFFRKIVERSQDDGKGASSANIMIAYTCCFQGRWDEAESLVIPLTMGEEKASSGAFDLLHTLALRKFQQNQTEQARTWCKRALLGKKRLVGKKNASYYQSMGLLASIYDFQGDAIEAEACRSFIPPNTVVEVDPLAYLFGTKNPLIPRTETGAVLTELPRRISTVQPISQQPKSHPRLVICIDFGVTFTCVAYCFKSENGNGSNINVFSKWPGEGSRLVHKVSSVIYYDQDQKVVGWGSDIADAITPTQYAKHGVHPVEFFKLRLAFDKRNTWLEPLQLPPVPSGKIAVHADYFRHVRIALQNDLKTHHAELYKNLESQIEWCFTNPSYGNEDTVADLRSAAIQAGYIRDENDHRVTFITDLEAALLSAARAGIVATRQNGVVLCVGLGGRLACLTAYEVTSVNPFTASQFTANTGDSCGSMDLNMNFGNLVRRKMREMKLRQGSSIEGTVWALTYDDFEHRIKASFQNTGENFSLHVKLEDATADIKDGYMTWTNEELLECFNPVVDRIIELIASQVETIQKRRMPLEAILLVGGFARNDYLFEKIKLSLAPIHQNRVVRPEEPQTAIAKGGVIAGLERGLCRTTKQMYIIETMEHFKPGSDPEYYRISSPDGRDRCSYNWGTVVDIGSTVSSIECRRLPMEKLLLVDESLVFEDAIYSGTTVNRYIVVSDTPVVGKIVTNLTHRKAEVLAKALEGPRGLYLKVHYDILFRYTSGKWTVTSEFKGEEVGSTTLDFR